MTSTSELPIQLELAILHIIEEGKGKIGFHEIARALEATVAPKSPPLLDAMEDLERSGFIRRRRALPGVDRWSITLAGRLRKVNCSFKG